MRAATRQKISKYVFPVLLALYPLWKIGFGIDLTDSCYGLVNFRFFPHAGQEWTVATWLANVLGAFLLRLPFGDTLIGIRFYTCLLVSAMALLSYYFLKGKMPAWIAFLGEFVAVSLCWIPTTSLYNYLTFALFLAGSVFLYRGLVWHRRSHMILAGVCLGANVLTRVPNVLECLLIVAVFYYDRLERRPAGETWRDVGACAAGFFGAFFAGLGVICLQFGKDAYGKMLAGLSGYSATDATYSPFSMFSSVLGAYVVSFKWVFLLAAAAAMGCVLFLLWPGKLEKVKCAVYLCMLPVLLRLLWGRGMFDFQYAFYWCVFEWFMVFLYAAVGLCVRALFDHTLFRRDKLLALFVLLILFVTPIGSNNETYPVMNNLFLAAPVTCWLGYRWYLKMRGRKNLFPVRAMLVAAGAFFLVQSAGFGIRSSFRDSIEGQPRDSRVTGNAKLAGVWTNRENAAALQDVVDFMESNRLTGAYGWQPILTFGDVPGFGWLFDMPSALSHDWPDMDTYPAARMEEDLEALAYRDTALPVVITDRLGVDFENEQEAKKWELLEAFLRQWNYTLQMDNGTYQIYTVKTAGEQSAAEDAQGGA